MSIPIIPDLPARVLRAIRKEPASFDMLHWHAVREAGGELEGASLDCGTVHCVAGMAVLVAHQTSPKIDVALYESVRGTSTTARRLFMLAHECVYPDDTAYHGVPNFDCIPEPGSPEWDRFGGCPTLEDRAARNARGIESLQAVARTNLVKRAARRWFEGMDEETITVIRPRVEADLNTIPDEELDILDVELDLLYNSPLVVHSGGHKTQNPDLTAEGLAMRARYPRLAAIFDSLEDIT